MKRLAHYILGVLFLASFSSLSVSIAALIYDPVTNTYIEQGSPTTTGSTTTGSVVSTGGVTTGGAATGVISTGPLFSTGNSTGITITSFTIPNPNTYKGTLAAMHVQLDKNTLAVITKLEENLKKLSSSNTNSLQQASDRLRVLACLGIITSPTNVFEALKESASSLRTSVEIVATDMHGGIGALEDKIDKKLLDQLIQQLEISSMQNKIDSFLTQYSNVTDLFYDVSIGKVEEIEKIFTNLSTDARKKIDAYDKNYLAYQSLMTAYTAFLSKSSFAGVVAAPNLNELVDLTDGMKTYRRSVLLTQRQNKIVAFMPVGNTTLISDQKKQLLQDFSLLFNEKTQSILGGLYPIDEILLLNKQVLSLRSAYTDEKSGFSDCQAFVTNPIINVSGPELESYMTGLLAKLNTAINKVATDKSAPTDKTALLAGLKKNIMGETEALITSLLDAHKQKIVELLEKKGQILLSFKNLSKQQQLEGAVRAYLQKKYLAALNDDTIGAFQDKLRTIAKKIEDKINSGQLTASQTKILSAIQVIVLEFIE